MSASKPQPEEQDRLIREKTQQLFEEDEILGEAGPRKAFAEYLRETPATPLSAWVKAALWAAGAVVVLLLLAALLRAGRPKPRPARPTATGAAEMPFLAACPGSGTDGIIKPWGRPGERAGGRDHEQGNRGVAWG